MHQYFVLKLPIDTWGLKKNLKCNYNILTKNVILRKYTIASMERP